MFTLADESLIGFLGVALLQLDDLVERLGSNRILENFRVLLERFAREFGSFRGDGLKPLVIAVAEAT